MGRCLFTVIVRYCIVF